MKHTDVLKDLEQAQDAENDLRKMVREADHFINKRDGQWEPDIIKRFDGKPRFTFDMISSIIDDIMGEMEQMSFDIRVNPAGGDSSKDTANAFEGIIRNIENISGARYIYNAAARIMTGTGFCGWRIITDYKDEDSFDQDLLIRSIPNVQDSVWFDPDACQQDMSDANFCFVLQSMTKREYEKKYPKGSGMSVGTDLRKNVYYHKKPDEIKIGEYLYKKKKERELVLLSNNMVMELNEEFMLIEDELKQSGIEIVDTRKRPYYVVYQRHFDGKDWLTDEKDSPFCYLPIVPLYGNFRISENKVIYYGCIEKCMDAQRVINYAESRKIEEGALSPRGKTWMTKDQAKSPDVRRTLRTLNTNSAPVQFYDHVDNQPPPQHRDAPVSNPGLIETSQSAQQFIQRTSGMFDESRGTAPPQRSGEAIELLQNKSDNPKRKWFTAVEIALAHTCRILIKAIPKVYDTTQQMRLINKDGTSKEITINQRVQDIQTGQMVDVYDLSKGSYEVVCSSGPAFHSRQQEANTAILELAKIDPSILQLGADIFLNNIQAPGVDKIAERKRLQMVNQGIVPQSQLTEEEQQMMAQKAQQPQEPDAMMIAAQAEMAKAQVQQQEVQLKLQMEQQKLQLKRMEMAIKAQSDQAKIEQDRAKQMMESLKSMSDQIKTQAEVLKIIREAMGADAVVTPAAAVAYQKQAEQLASSVSSQ